MQYGQFRALVFGLTDRGIFFIYFYFYSIIFYCKQYVVRGAQFSVAGLNGALMKKKKTATHKTNKDKNNGTNKSKGGSYDSAIVEYWKYHGVIKY